jgi:DNA polymerase III epsilon subunit-like protein
MNLPIMIDIETAGLRPGAAIMEIGAATFDEHGTIHETFFTSIDILDAAGQGLTIERGTAAWHHSLGTQTPRGASLWNALSSFSLWLNDHAPCAVWAWGMDFERPMLEAAYHRIHAVLPWH